MMRSFFFISLIILSGCQGETPLNDVRPDGPPASPSTDRLLMIYEMQGPDGNPLTLPHKQSQLLVTQLQERLNPDGNNGINTRVREMTTLEVLLPADVPLEQQRLKDLLSQSGFLEFRVLANKQFHQPLLKAISGTTKLETDAVVQPLSDDSQVTIGKWVQIARGPPTEAGHRAYKYIPRDDVVRDMKTGNLVSLEPFQPKTEEPGLELARFLESENITDIQVLVVTGDGCHLTGAMISSATSLASDGQSTIDIHFTPSGTAELTKLTAKHKPSPDRRHYCKMAIILDDQILTAPRIMEEVRSKRVLITGSFNEAEVEEIATLLRSGSLPKGLRLKFLKQQLVPSLQP